MRLNSRIGFAIDEVYSDYDFLNDTMLYSDHYKRKVKDDSISVSPMDAYAYQGNLFGLFSKLNIPPHWHVLVMYYNDIQNPVDYDGMKTVFYMPSEDIYTRIYSLQ